MPGRVTDEGDGLSWRTPANLLDCVELEVRRIFGDADGHSDPEWHAEVLLTILLPELRGVLREAGLLIPKRGPHSTREPPQFGLARRRSHRET